MNRSLLARTKPEFYTDAARAARFFGATEEEIAAQMASDIREAKALLEGKCPECGAPIRRTVDYARQYGPSNMPGVWVAYRCSTQPPIGQPRPEGVCDFMVDLKEGEASN